MKVKFQLKVQIYGIVFVTTYTIFLVFLKFGIQVRLNDREKKLTNYRFTINKKNLRLCLMVVGTWVVNSGLNYFLLIVNINSDLAESSFTVSEGERGIGKAAPEISVTLATI